MHPMKSIILGSFLVEYGEWVERLWAAFVYGVVHAWMHDYSFKSWSAFQPDLSWDYSVHTVDKV